jgi:outer membrane immunogenic protein
MKKTLIAAAALAGLLATGNPAMAEGYSLKDTSTSHTYGGRWGGWYYGGNLGFANLWSRFGDDDDRFDNENLASVRNGFTAGVQTGYNWQYGSTVIGIESDFNLTSINKEFKYNQGDDANRVKMDYFGTVRARVGLASDRTLAYVTAGLAFANLNQLHTELNQETPDFFKSNRVNFGVVVGGGVEFAATQNMSLKLEGLYVMLNEEDGVKNGRLGQEEFGRFGNDFAVVRLGLNFKH